MGSKILPHPEQKVKRQKQKTLKNLSRPKMCCYCESAVLA
nr:MAG TPA_asm: Herpesvirus glycoprotein H C-terminal domain [Caudoviricetes sp.]